MTEQTRKEFEAAWADVMRGDEPPPGRKPTRSRIDPEKYAGGGAQFAWVWWQRSREAIEIELPTVCASDDPFELKRDIICELEEAGLKVKP